MKNLSKHLPLYFFILLILSARALYSVSIDSAGGRPENRFNRIRETTDRENGEQATDTAFEIIMSAASSKIPPKGADEQEPVKPGETPHPLIFEFLIEMVNSGSESDVIGTETIDRLLAMIEGLESSLLRGAFLQLMANLTDETDETTAADSIKKHQSKQLSKHKQGQLTRDPWSDYGNIDPYALAVVRDDSSSGPKKLRAVSRLSVDEEAQHRIIEAWNANIPAEDDDATDAWARTIAGYYRQLAETLTTIHNLKSPHGSVTRLKLLINDFDEKIASETAPGKKGELELERDILLCLTAAFFYDVQANFKGELSYKQHYKSEDFGITNKRAWNELYPQLDKLILDRVTKTQR